ncbi:hypothetical protein C0J52_12978 [Blattella germanica]|nr:hypothetical protein C0J52_12978 [Blattella germanica]
MTMSKYINYTSGTCTLMNLIKVQIFIKIQVVPPIRALPHVAMGKRNIDYSRNTSSASKSKSKYIYIYIYIPIGSYN